MTADQATTQNWLRIIKAEYLEMPGLQLTRPQIQRLWLLEPDACDMVLDALTSSAFLRKTSRQSYVLADRAVR